MQETIEKISGITFVPKNAAELYKECLKPENMADGELFLNVVVPENFQTANKKPVMVWLHGGGWTLGGADEVIFYKIERRFKFLTSRDLGQLWLCMLTLLWYQFLIA